MAIGFFPDILKLILKFHMWGLILLTHCFKSFKRCFLLPESMLSFFLFELINFIFQIIKMEHWEQWAFSPPPFYAFNSKSAKATRDNCAVYGECGTAERTTHDLYAKFKNGNFYLKDAPCLGRLFEFHEKRLNYYFSTKIRIKWQRKLAEKM